MCQLLCRRKSPGMNARSLGGMHCLYSGTYMKGLVARFRIYFIRLHGARLEFHQTAGIIHETR